MITPSEPISIESPGPGICTVTVCRADRLNALDRAALLALDGAITKAAADESVRVLILAGEGQKAFIAGSDLKALEALGPQGAADWSRIGQRIVRRLIESPSISIAAVDGFALGSGFELALACDLIVASTRARFGLPETGLGLIPGHGGTALLPRKVGSARARDWILTGRTIAADEAERSGLVTPPLVEPGQAIAAAMTLAGTLVARSRSALAAAKSLFVDPTLDAALARETATFANLFGTDDQREGLSAFRERRTPRFGPPGANPPDGSPND